MEQEQLDTLKERVHAFMREDAYRPLPEAEVRTGLGLPEADEPLLCVANGTGKALEEIKSLKQAAND